MPLTLDELLFEPNAPPEERRSDVYARFHLMCLNPSRRDLFEVLAERLIRCKQQAVPRAEELLRSAGESGQTPEPELKEFTRFTRGLSELSTVISKMPAEASRSRPDAGIAAGIWDVLEEEATQILRDGEAFRQVVRDSLDSYGSDQRTNIERAIRLVHDAMEEVGVERQEILRDARALLNGVLDDPEAMADPVLWFYQGWLSWRRNLDPETTRNAFFQACLGSSAEKNVLYWLSCRHLAYLQAQNSDFVSAYSTVRQALAVRTDAPTFLDTARYAAAAGRPKEAAGAAIRCMALQPLTALEVPAGGVLSESKDFLVWVIRVQREAVRAADKAEASLQETLARIRQAESASGLELAPVGLEKPKEAKPPDSLFEAEFAARRAQRQTRETFDSAVVKLKLELVARQDLVDQRKAALELAGLERTQTLDAAQRHKQAVAQAVAKEIASLDDKGEGFQQGCACGMAFGCLALGGFIAYSLIMVVLGRQSGVSSPIGVMFMVSIVAPIAIAILMQIVYGLKRMMVESELAAKLRQAEEVCESVAQKAEGAFRTRQPGLADELAEAETEAQKIRSALQSLTGESDEPPADPAPPDQAGPS